MAVITATTLLNAITTKNAQGTATNATQTAFQTTSSCFSLEASLLNSAGMNSAQTTFRIYFAYSSLNISGPNFAQACANPMCLEIAPRVQNNGTTIVNTPAIPVLGLYLYWWVDIPTITTNGGTLTLILNEHT